MSAEECRRKAQQFLSIAQQLSRPEDRVALVTVAAFWMERAEEVERRQRVAQQQQQMQPKKEPEAESS